MSRTREAIMFAKGTAAVEAALLAPPAPTGILIPALYLVGALLLGAVVIAVVNRWRRQSGPVGLTPNDQLAHFRTLYERGAMSQEEFERIRSVLGGELQRAVKKSASPAIAPGPVPSAPNQQAQPPTNNGSAGPEPPETGIRPA